MRRCGSHFCLQPLIADIYNFTAGVWKKLRRPGQANSADPRVVPVGNRPDAGRVAPWISMKLRADQTGQRGLPMPLWLQGALESAQAAVISALVVVAPIVTVWANAGFQHSGFDVLARLAGQAWLLIHGVPLLLDTPGCRVRGAPGIRHALPHSAGADPHPVPARLARRPAARPRLLYGPALAGAARLLARVCGVRDRHGLRLPHGRRRHQPLVRRLDSAHPVRARHGGRRAPRGRLVEPADRRRRRGLAFPHQPALPLGRLLPGLGHPGRVGGAHGEPGDVGGAARRRPLHPLEPRGRRL